MKQTMNHKTTRLNKYIAQCGVCSRRDADKLIEKEVVTVNGITARPGMPVTEADEVSVYGKPLKNPEKKVILAYYKPVGVTCTERDRHAKIKVSDNVRYPTRVTYAGRLDKDSEGLLLLTNDGELIDAMMRGANRHEKEYVVKVDKTVTDDAVMKMREGIYLEELGLATRPCMVTKTGEKTINMILTQGVNRQIRRMCKAVGYQVRSLKRTRVMSVNLANLKPGEYRELNEEETKLLYSLCKLTH